MDHTAVLTRRIAALVDGFSLQPLRLDPEGIAALNGAVEPGTAIYLACSPGRPLVSVIEPAKRLRAAGFEPVPHVAARNIASAGMLDDLLANLAAQTGARRLMVVAGDRERPAGPYDGAIDIIESGLLQRHGVAEVDIAGYPDGHPRISELALHRALAAKVEAAAQTGLGVQIVTQFCFEGATVVDWLARLRQQGIETPVRVGMAGPSNLPSLIRFAQHCGVRASAQALARHAGLMKHLVGASTPDSIIRALAEAEPDRLGQVTAHFYAFGGVAATGRWAAAVKAGHLVLDHADGFSVEP